ncbi:MAG: hypothetical protein K2N80_06165 [Lachnospiraceae bacterium]|nr:hypothetical protein [Lachnospiraceae bacterium]
MKLLKTLKQKTENRKNTDKNESASLQNKSPEETYQEKKRQLKFEQADLDNQKRKYEQDTRMDALQKELEQIEPQMQAVHAKNKKSWLKLLLFWVIVTIAMAALFFYIKNSHQQELEVYRQQLETDLNEYIIETEARKQDLQQQIEALTQQLNSLKSSTDET